MDGGIGSMTTELVVRPLAPTFGAEVLGIDLTKPMSDATFASIEAALWEHGVLLFRGQTITPGDQVAFSRRFGDLEIHSAVDYLHPEHPEVVVIGNLVVEGKPRAMFARGDEQWHADSSFRPIPSNASLFFGVETPPEGGDTMFLDAAAAYDELPAGLKARIKGVKGVHDQLHLGQVVASRNPGRAKPAMRKFDPVPQPLAAKHPVTGRGTIFIAPDVISHVEGMGAAEGKALVEDLEAHATQPRYVYAHKWLKGDLVVWDNRRTLHTASMFDADKYLRVMHRTTVVGTKPLEAA
jgi:taurine dioxygenase